MILQLMTRDGKPLAGLQEQAIEEKSDAFYVTIALPCLDDFSEF
jgi:hypothetical protein